MKKSTNHIIVYWKAKTGLEHPSLAGVKKDIFFGLPHFGGKWESNIFFNSSATYAANDWTAPRLWGSTWSLCTWTWRGSAATSVTVTSGSHPSPLSPLTWKKSTGQNGWPASVHFVGRPTGRLDHTNCFVTWYCNSHLKKDTFFVLAVSQNRKSDKNYGFLNSSIIWHLTQGKMYISGLWFVFVKSLANDNSLKQYKAEQQTS